MVVMERSTAALLGELRKSGREQLDLSSFRLACDVAAEVVGLTDSNQRRLATRILNTFNSLDPGEGGKRGGLKNALRSMYHTGRFWWQDIKPAMRTRRGQDKEDVLSCMVAEGYSNKAILIECMTYATADMIPLPRQPGRFARDPHLHRCPAAPARRAPGQSSACHLERANHGL